MTTGLYKKGMVLGIIVLFFGASIVPSIAGYDKDLEKNDYILSENETLNMKNDEHNNLIKQVIKSGVISNDDWLEQDKLLASDEAGDDYFGRSVSIDGDYAIVGARLDDDNGEHSGSAYVFTRSGTDWTEQAKLLPSDGAYWDDFGYSVSIDGDYAIIGAYADDNDNGASSGSAYVIMTMELVLVLHMSSYAQVQIGPSRRSCFLQTEPPMTFLAVLFQSMVTMLL